MHSRTLSLPLSLLHVMCCASSGPQVFRIGNLVYMSDVKCIPHAVRPYFAGSDVVVMDVLAADEDDKGVHPSHFKFREAVDEIRSGFGGACTPAAVWCVGMSHKLAHDDVDPMFERAGLPQVKAAWDGQHVPFTLNDGSVGRLGVATVPATVHAADRIDGVPAEVYTTVLQPPCPPFNNLGSKLAGVHVELAACARPVRLPPVELIGDKIKLRHYNADTDAAALYAVSNGTPCFGHDAYDQDEKIWKYMPRGPHHSQEELIRSMDVILQAPDCGAVFTLIDKATDAIVGSITLMAHVPEALRVEIGAVWCSPAYQGSFAIKESVYLLLRYAFETLQYRRVEWKCHMHNVRSRKAAVKFGFRFEGIFRNHMMFKGTVRHTAWFAMTGEDWFGDHDGTGTAATARGVKAAYLSLLDAETQAYYAKS